MDPKCQGEIAVLLLKHIVRKKGIYLSPDDKREIGNIAKEIGIPVEELKQFAKPIVQELLDECLK